MLWAVIMAGGHGTRFWPESRRKTPKQFLRFFSPRTLIEETAKRLQGIVPSSRIIVVTAKDKASLVRKLLRKVPEDQILGEPVGRNTAPCAVLAASLALKKDPHAVIALLPSDHHIQNVGSFRKTLKAAAHVAAHRKMPVTFGIKPDFPHTGYGYLELGSRSRGVSGLRVFHLKKFHEKPSLPKAKRFVKSGKFLWNSGMFVWDAAALLHSAKRLLPKAYALSEQMTKGPFQSKFSRLFPKMPNISIDYGLMEKLRGKILAIRGDFGWSDIGGWRSFAELCKKDAYSNVTFGNSLLINSSGNIVRGGDKLVVLLGVHEHTVVDTHDALLICHKNETESIRRVVEELQKRKWHKYL